MHSDSTKSKEIARLPRKQLNEEEEMIAMLLKLYVANMKPMLILLGHPINNAYLFDPESTTFCF